MHRHSAGQAIHGMISHHLDAIFRETDDLGRDGWAPVRDQHSAIAYCRCIGQARDIDNQAANARQATGLLTVIGPNQL
jgi:hypothetical protein